MNYIGLICSLRTGLYNTERKCNNKYFNRIVNIDIYIYMNIYKSDSFFFSILVLYLFVRLCVKTILYVL